jgi:DNA-binding winged helix-turn-helix (wHTH) protein
MPQVGTSQVIRFATFEVDLQAQELRKGGLRLKLSGQPFQVLAILLERPGTVVTREELQKRLWPDTFVDVDHNLNTAINKIREALGDSSENPRFVETLPRRGYRFIAPVDRAGNGAKPAMNSSTHTAAQRRWQVLGGSLLFGALLLLASAGFLAYKGRHAPALPGQRTLTRITFDDGLQIGATWSPDGRFIATVPIAAENPTSGCSRSAAAIPFKSPRDQVTIGNRTGHPMEAILLIVPRRAKEAYISCRRSAEQDWNARSRRLDIFHAGPQTVPRYCFRLILRRWI